MLVPGELKSAKKNLFKKSRSSRQHREGTHAQLQRRSGTSRGRGGSSNVPGLYTSDVISAGMRSEIKIWVLLADSRGSVCACHFALALSTERRRT